MNLRVIALLIILSLTIRGKPVEETIQAAKASPVMPDKPKKAKVKRAKPKAADKNAVDFMNSSLGEWILEYSESKDIDPFLIVAYAKRNINTPSDYALKVSERAVELSRLYEVAE